MDSRSAGIAGFALLTLVLVAACSENGDTTVLPPDNGATGITVTGEGEAEAPPDTGFFAVGVAVTAPSVAEARDRAATAGSGVIGSVKANGVADRDVQTIEVNIYPNYDYTKPEAPRLTGYTMTNTVSVKVRNISSFSKVIDDALIAGGDNARLNSLSFGIEDDKALLEEARKKAMEDARGKAEELAALAGVTLGSRSPSTSRTIRRFTIARLGSVRSRRQRERAPPSKLAPGK